MRGENLPMTTGKDLLLDREEIVEAARKFNLLSDVFLSVALDDIGACQHVLRVIMECPDLIVRSVRTQYEISKIVSHGARLDVLASDNKNKLYHIEIQNRNDGDHTKRTRFYNAMVDSEFLKKGEDYTSLPELHFIYISKTDIWNGGRVEYKVKKLLDGTEFVYDDGIYIHYINAEVDDGSKKAELMKYFKSADPSDYSQGDLSKRIHFLKCEKEGDHIMCEITEKFVKMGEKIGESRGAANEAARLNSLNQRLLQEKRYSDLERSTKDRGYQEALLKEYCL